MIINKKHDVDLFEVLMHLLLALSLLVSIPISNSHPAEDVAAANLLKNMLKSAKENNNKTILEGFLTTHFVFYDCFKSFGTDYFIDNFLLKPENHPSNIVVQNTTIQNGTMEFDMSSNTFYADFEMKNLEHMSTNNEDDFDIVDFCKRHLRVTSWANERSQVYKTKELHGLCKAVIPILKEEPTLAVLSPPCTIVGDIHGQYRDLIRILNHGHHNDIKKMNKDQKMMAYTNNRFMFLGDFVDRGPHSVECICLVFSLKVIYPQQYMLLRGNHETKSINYAYGFREELVNKLGEKDGLDVWNHFNEAFAYMPLAGLIGNKILCMHGGISPRLSSLEDIINIKRPVIEVENNTLECDLLWSDPLNCENIHVVDDRPRFLPNSLRGLSVAFNEKAVEELVAKLNIDTIVRAHQVQDFGFKFYADRKMVTIFSAPRYMLEMNNLGAFIKVAENGAMAIIIMKAKPIEKDAKGDDKKKKKDNKEKPRSILRTATAL